MTEEFPDATHRDGPTLRFRTSSEIQRYNFIKFNVSTIQPGTTIKSATLKFYWYAQSDNRHGIGLYHSSYNIITENTILDSSQRGIDSRG